MSQALLIIDVQPSFDPPQWLIDGIRKIISNQHSVPLLYVMTNPESFFRNSFDGTLRRPMTA
jgi:nicotinamidase-related amidase